MNRLRIGSVLGLELTIDWSWFINLALLLWSFSAGVFPAGYPQLAPTTHLLMGIAASVLFFASLLAHELGHARAAGAFRCRASRFSYSAASRNRVAHPYCGAAGSFKPGSGGC